MYGFVGNDGVTDWDYLGLDPLGHHLVPQALWRNCPSSAQGRLKEVLNDITARIDGPGYKKHNGKPYGNVSEPTYSKAVAELLGGKDICCMTKEELQDLVQRVKEAGHPISTYNKAVKEEMEKAVEQAAKEKAEREAREKQQREAAEKRAREKAQREAAERESRKASNSVVKRVGKRAVKLGAKVLAPVFFVYDWSGGGFGHAVAEATWPFSIPFAD